MATTTFNRLLAAALCASIALAPMHVGVAHAEPTAADLETARDLYKQAKKLRAEGDLKGALEKLKAAHALAGTPITGVELGKTYMDLGQLVEAREAFLEVARMPIGAKESANAKAARAEAAKLEADVAPRIPSIVVELTGVPDGATATVTIDGLPIPQAAITEPRKVDPGAHLVAAHVGDGPESSIQIEVKEKETRSVELAVKAPTKTTTATTSSAGSSTAPPPNPASTTPTARTEDRGLSPWFWVGVAVAGVGVASGAVTGILSSARATSVKNQCSGHDCPPAAQNDIDGAKATGTISTVSFIVAGVGATVAIIGFVTSDRGDARKDASKPRVDVAVGLGSIAVVGAF